MRSRSLAGVWLVLASVRLTTAGVRPTSANVLLTVAGVQPALADVLRAQANVQLSLASVRLALWVFGWCRRASGSFADIPPTLADDRLALASDWLTLADVRLRRRTEGGPLGEGRARSAVLYRSPRSLSFLSPGTHRFGVATFLSPVATSPVGSTARARVSQLCRPGSSGKLLDNPMPHSFYLFLSHNSEDKPVVREIAAGLSRWCFKPWLDACDDAFERRG